MTVGSAKPKEDSVAGISMPERARHRGFTLIEMMIVVAIVAVLAAIAVPSFQDFMAKSRAKNAAEAIYGFLNQAKSEAILRDQDVYIDFVGGNDWCIGFIPIPAAAPGTTCDCSASPATCVANVGATPVTQVISSADFPQVTLTSSFGGGDTVISRLRGTANSNGTLDITSNGWGLQTRVSVLGRIRNCKPTDQAYKDVTGYEVCN